MAKDTPKNDPDSGGTTPPWGDDFDSEKAWNLITGLRSDKSKQASRIKELEDAAKDLDAAKNSGKSEVEKLTAQVAKLNEDLAQERSDRVRLEVATAKGLTPAQAKRLSGNTREELETDADDLLATFPAGKKDDTDGDAGGDTKRRTTGAPGKPVENLGGGTNPDSGDPVEVDPAKLAQTVPRH